MAFVALCLIDGASTAAVEVVQGWLPFAVVVLSSVGPICSVQAAAELQSKQGIEQRHLAQDNGKTCKPLQGSWCLGMENFGGASARNRTCGEDDAICNFAT